MRIFADEKWAVGQVSSLPAAEAGRRSALRPATVRRDAVPLHYKDSLRAPAVSAESMEQKSQE